MPLHYSVQTGTLLGMHAEPVRVEVDIGAGLPGILIVGLADHAVQEARERVRSALRFCGFKVPQSKIVVNLAPGMLKKTGTGFDLPIAIAILCATKQIPAELFSKTLVVGELSLEGEVRPVQGMLAYAIAARDCDARLVCSSSTNLRGIGTVSCHRLSNLRSLKTNKPWEETKESFVKKTYEELLDFADIAGESIGKRALIISAAGAHGAMMIGPPGSGKTMLAKRMPGILPPLNEEEIAQSSILYSVAGLETSALLQGIRPIRAPHHSASNVGLIGGGNPVKPGEVSLAHNGVLFLDEMSEFSPRVLQGLRQPIETGEVCIVRANSRIVFPSRFMLLAASNPCPCGYLGDGDIPCKCSETQINKYEARIGGPLIDRIDLVVHVFRSKPSDVLETGKGLSSAMMREKVLAARERKEWREKNRSNGDKDLDSKDNPTNRERTLLEDCSLEYQTRKRFETIAQTQHLSGRGIIRTLKVARTIADLDESGIVKDEHLLEALAYRVRIGN